RDVGHRLARAQTDLATRQIDGAATELNDADLERHPSPERWLLEDEHDRAAADRLTAAPRLPTLLERRGHPKEMERALAAEIGRGDEVVHREANTRSMISSARSHSRSSTISGGARRMTFSPALRIKRPASRHASTMGAAGTDSSAPIKSPLPRISRIT